MLLESMNTKSQKKKKNFEKHTKSQLFFNI